MKLKKKNQSLCKILSFFFFVIWNSANINALSEHLVILNTQSNTEFMIWFHLWNICLNIHHFRGGLSTYKELCAIASDLNQPDLIYKFMHLANHNATWNTRKVGNTMNTLYNRHMALKKVCILPWNDDLFLKSKIDFFT